MCICCRHMLQQCPRCCSQCSMYIQLKGKKNNQFLKASSIHNGWNFLNLVQISIVLNTTALSEKTLVLKVGFISIQKELLQSVSNLNCAQYYRQQTQECPKIQKAVGNPTAHIFRLTSCPKLGKIKQNIVEKHAISVKKEEK